MAAMAGPGGRVVAVDLQAAMLDRVRARAEAAGLGSRITLQISSLIVMGAAVYAFYALRWKAVDGPVTSPAEEPAGA